MKINLIIRTYKVENLLISLYDIPKKISSENIELFIHNDNPDKQDEFIKLVDEFNELYPDYKVITIQESKNQQMFMSFLNTIGVITPDNEWTMILDDDDTLCEFNNEVLNYINSVDSSKYCIKYRFNKCLLSGSTQTPIELDGYTSAWYKWHRIYPTKALKSVYKNRKLIISMLEKYNGSTKFTACEDELMYRLVLRFNDIERIKYDKELINYSIYEHDLNGYATSSNGLTELAIKNHKIVDAIIDNIR